ncbi:hypothetical protein VNO77_01896 [Canavalia gladiata]|uniref:Uncharacterized protein n=1 Tax=Canavalia gladiata TaxID=3824 RepID=A0AAN9RAR3_CANGL
MVESEEKRHGETTDNQSQKVQDIVSGHICHCHVINTLQQVPSNSFCATHSKMHGHHLHCFGNCLILLSLNSTQLSHLMHLLDYKEKSKTWKEPPLCRFPCHNSLAFAPLTNV